MKADRRPPARGVLPAGVVALRGGVAEHASDWLADEVPVALVFNGISHTVMLVTPAELEDFALGFALTEGLIDHPAELLDVDHQPTPEGIELRLEVTAACAWRLRERRRSMAGRTGCGLCGAESLAQVRQPVPALAAVRLSPAAVARAQRELRMRQPMQQLTGAAHAAAWCSPEGKVLLVREDIGRHNALDKLIGAMVRARIDPRGGFACITSRASFEMVQKSARAGIAALAAVSAPTALAVELAQRCGQLLIGFARGDDLVAYTFPERLGLLPADTHGDRRNHAEPAPTAGA